MISVPVTEASQVAEVRRRASLLATGLGFDGPAVGRVALVATELATNLVKYGTAGEIVLAVFEEAGEAGIEVLALDRGRGLANLDEALLDGHSTGGTAGTGLGAVRRQSSSFDIAAWPGRGVVVLARVGPRRPDPDGSPASAIYGAVSVPLRGETANGDAVCFRRREDGWVMIVADGLGHGPNAAQASDAALRIFRDHEDEPPAGILNAVHAGLRATRGAAVSVARYETARGMLTYCGVGNVAGVVVNLNRSNGTVSLAGTLGHVARRFQEFEYHLVPGGIFVMHSDGIGTGWRLDDYPGLVAAHPALVAGVLYRDFGRARDDATVAIVRAET